MACDCIDKINKDLEESGNGLLSTTMFGNPDTIVIPILRRDTHKPETRRGKTSAVLPTFCPFCGKRHKEEKKAEAES